MFDVNEDQLLQAEEFAELYAVFAGVSFFLNRNSGCG